MPMVRAMRMLNAIEAGMLSGEQLETLLTNDSGRLAEFNVLLSMRGQMRRIVASNTSITAIANSSAAMSAIIASSAALDAVMSSSAALATVVSSSVAMTAIINSNTAMDAIVSSSAALDAVMSSSAAMSALGSNSVSKLYMYNSDAMLDAIAGSTTAIDALRAAPEYRKFNTNNTTGTIPRTLAGTNVHGLYIALGVSTSDSSTGATITVTTKRTGTTRPDTHITDSESTSSTLAFGSICCPLKTTFNAISTDSSVQTFYVGMLRCDV